jgi:hypothetical protein
VDSSWEKTPPNKITTPIINELRLHTTTLIVKLRKAPRAKGGLPLRSDETRRDGLAQQDLDEIHSTVLQAVYRFWKPHLAYESAMRATPKPAV